jgi:hypothetical protein
MEFLETKQRKNESTYFHYTATKFVRLNANKNLFFTNAAILLDKGHTLRGERAWEE